MSKPNILLLVVDSLRADAVFGSRVNTPGLDAHASRGVAFHQCICTSTTTTPSFSSLLTGCYPPKHGVRGLQGYRLSSSLTTMAEAFGDAGYRTYAEVTGPLLNETGILRGFHVANHRQAYRVPFFGWRDEVIERMASYENPWFMLLHIWEVHRPYRSPPDFVKRKDREGYERAVAATDEWLGPLFDAAGDRAIIAITGDHGEEYPDSLVKFQLVRVARKAGRIAKLSEWFPYLDKRLAALDIGHGFALHEHLVRVPLILSGPGIPHRPPVTEQVRHVDLFPTLADLCGIGIPEDMDGRSLRPLLQGGTLPEEPAYMEAVGVKLEGKRIQGVRTPDWKLLRSGTSKPTLLKLDGGDAPDERHNVHSRYPEVAQALESFLLGVEASKADEPSGMTQEEEAIVEKHLRDLGYL